MSRAAVAHGANVTSHSRNTSACLEVGGDLCAKWSGPRVGAAAVVVTLVSLELLLWLCERERVGAHLAQPIARWLNLCICGVPRVGVTLGRDGVRVRRPGRWASCAVTSHDVSPVMRRRVRLQGMFGDKHRCHGCVGWGLPPFHSVVQDCDEHSMFALDSDLSPSLDRTN